MRKTWGVVWGAAAVLTGAAGCGDAGDAATLPAGRYHYVASHPIPDSEDSVRMEGVLEITRADDEGLEGRWDVPRMHPELQASVREGGAVELNGRPTYFGTLVHTIRPADGGYRCNGRYLWVAEGGVERTLPVSCAISTDVPPGLGVPAPTSPVVRPIDEDTVPG